MKFINSKKGMIIIGSVLAVLAIIYIIYYFRTHNDKYGAFEKEMMSATAEYIKANEIYKPTAEKGSIILLKDLYTTLFIETKMDSCDQDASYVYAKLEGEAIKYEAYLKCDGYETEIKQVDATK